MPRENLPYWQLYPGDIRRDVGFNSLSYHYRGIWWELLMFMHCSEDRGRLVANGRPISTSGVARLLGLSEPEADKAIQVFLDSGVASRDEAGALINRRMVREEQTRRSRAEAGRKGGVITGATYFAAAKPQAKPKQTPDNDNDLVENTFKIRISRLFRRRLSTPWSVKEMAAVATLRDVEEEDVVAIEAYYAEKIPGDKDIRRRDMLTLLNNWNGEVDRAKARPKPKRKAAVNNNNGHEPPAPPSDPAKEADFQRRLKEWKEKGRPLGEFPEAETMNQESRNATPASLSRSTAGTA